MKEAVLKAWLVGIAVAAGAWALGWLLRVIVWPALKRVAERSRTTFDDALLVALRPHVPLWFLLLGLVVGARYAPLSAEVRHAVDLSCEALFILSTSLAISTFLLRLLQGGDERWSAAFGNTSLVHMVVRLGVLSLGAMVVLSNLGVSITPILTALGVGSLAIALGLQPTLTNLFAGFHITVTRLVRIGDLVELDNGMQGVVEDIGWRSTQLRELSNNLVVVPNAKLAEMTVRNYTLPSPEIGFGVPVTIGWRADPALVERVTLEEAQAVMRATEGAVPGFAPLVRYGAYTDTGVQLNVILRARSMPDRFLLTSELLRRLHLRYRLEGIEVPTPQRVTLAAAADPPARRDG